MGFTSSFAKTANQYGTLAAMNASSNGYNGGYRIGKFGQPSVKPINTNGLSQEAWNLINAAWNGTPEGTNKIYDLVNGQQFDIPDANFANVNIYNDYYVMSNYVDFKNPDGSYYEDSEGNGAYGEFKMISGLVNRNNSQAQSGGGVNTDAWGNGLNAFGFANGAKTEIIDYAVRSGSSQAGIRAELQILGKTGTRYLSAAKDLSKKAAWAGVAVTALDAGMKGEWQNHHTADVLIGLSSLYLLTGPVGWAIGGGYFLLDVGIKSYTGKSITENLFD
jgi:hypothetical protein